ncbi:MAG: protein of unknown function DUF354 [uncultured Solirubrobacteraceae bacterium]|uniref:DUF354 domain-containing protein n=1 Tax=uncultured Solirubrobacteraceae bacterium TaxID=1162706 RepID=A0A6J4R5G3_9ACTN|nr:MAG: protein of unknown function DUF354 [uncultured Solirubrobacteraceae bacterium]
MRIWVDLSAPAHPVVFRPVVEELRRRGHEVLVTARDYAETLALTERLGLGATPLGSHGGAGRTGKLVSLMARTIAMQQVGRAGFDLALAHGSNELALAAAALRIPAVNMFDYEFATTQHRIGCRFARRVLVPESIPLERLARFGVGRDNHAPFPGLKEEYYLSDFEADPSVLDSLGLDRSRIIVVLRPPPDVSLYHRRANPLFPQVLMHVSGHGGAQSVVLPRTQRQREDLKALRLPGVMVADRAVDGQSLVALADLVVSAGGTMNREAVALGTPVYTIYGGRLGGVDEQLMREGRLRPLTDPRALDLDHRPPGAGERIRRDPAVLTDLMLEAVA